jgi:hypothetical protein
LDRVGRRKGNREGQQKEQEKQVKASHSHIPGGDFQIRKVNLLRASALPKGSFRLEPITTLVS